MEPQIRYCKTSDGVSIAYYAVGEGIPLVMTAGVWSHIAGWWRLRERDLRRLASIPVRLIQYDGRGCGSSDRESVDFSLEARMRDLEAVVEQMELREFALLGVTFGASTAVQYAADHPERVSHLILIAPYLNGELVYQSVPMFKGFESLRDMAPDQWEMFTLLTANVNSAYSDAARAREAAAIMREAMTPAAHRALIEATRRVNVEAQLPGISAPTLVTHMTLPNVPVSLSHRAATDIPNARMLVTDDDARTSVLNFNDDELRAMRELLGAPDAGTASFPDDSAGGLRTILFTDVESNTELLQRLGDDAWRTVLRDHERISRQEIAIHGGAQVKTTGDGFMASFGSATRAIECAVAMQRAFSARNASAEHAVTVRIGLNAGEPIAENDDLFGTAVTMAARIMDRAKGGEILVSDVVRQLVAGKGFEFADRGEVVLRGFDDPVRLFRVRMPEHDQAEISRHDEGVAS